MLINRKAVKAHAIDFAKANRPRFTRVSKEFYAVMDGKMKLWINEYIHRLPSVGKTIK